MSRRSRSLCRPYECNPARSAAFALPRTLFAAVLGALLILLPARAWTHPIDNAALVIQELEAGRFSARFQSDSPALRSIEHPAVYPPHCELKGELLSCGPAGLSGRVELPWLEGAQTRVLVDVSWLDGSRFQRVVSSENREIAIYDQRARGLAAYWLVLRDYCELGVEHILLGFDHLCFVLALTLLVQGRRRLIATITAFTVAHSITLALSAVEWIAPPILPIEATIALSIVLVCRECLAPQESLTRRRPWTVAFIFGLLHGFGFASALRDVGLPEAHVPAALFGFNVGVELGQLAVVFGLLVLAHLGTRLGLRRPWVPRALAYGMGAVGAFWSIERTFAILGLG